MVTESYFRFPPQFSKRLKEVHWSIDSDNETLPGSPQWDDVNCVEKISHDFSLVFGHETFI